MKAKISTKYIKSLNHQICERKHYDSELKGFYLLVSPKGRITFYCRIYMNGRDSTYKIGRYPNITATQARDQAIVVLADAVKGINAQDEKKKEKIRKLRENKLTLGGFMENIYSNYLLAEKRSGPLMIKNIERYFSQWYGKRLLDITEFLVMNWRKEQLKRGLSAGGVNRPIACLRALLNYAYSVVKIIDHHPLGRFKQMKEDKNKIIRYLTVAEEERLRNALILRDDIRRKKRKSGNEWRSQRGVNLLKAIPSDGYSDHLTPMVLLAINTGMRRGELFNLKWKDIDLNSNSLAIHAYNSKSKTTRIVPLNSEVVSLLRNWKKQTHFFEYVFYGEKGEKLTDIKKAWVNLLVSANIEKFRFHDTRHHFASKLVSAGVALNTVRELLGHSDLQMTMRYAHLAPNLKSEAVEFLVKGITSSGGVIDVSCGKC